MLPAARLLTTVPWMVTLVPLVNGMLPCVSTGKSTAAPPLS